jgi:alkyl hydroperoxide reductase 1
MSDGDAKWSKSIGLDKDLSGIGFGIRTERYAMILENNVVKYIGVSICFSIKNQYPFHTSLNSKLKVEPGAGVTVAGVDAVLAKC